MARQTMPEARLKRYASMLQALQLPYFGHGYITCFGIVQMLTSVM